MTRWAPAPASADGSRREPCVVDCAAAGTPTAEPPAGDRAASPAASGSTMTQEIARVDALLAADSRGLARLLHGPVTAWVVLVVSGLLTAAAWYVSNEYIEQRTADRFRFRTVQVVDAVRQRMLAYEQVLRGGVGLFDASRQVSREAWRDYVTTLRIDEYYPGIQGMGVSVPVAAADLDEHVASVRAEGYPGYTVRPATPRENYHAIVYLEPFDWRNQRAFGFDMYSNPVRRQAMQRAIDTGLPTISSMVTLVQEIDRDVQRGFLFYLPVYRHGSDPQTVEQRRRVFVGLVYAAFRADDLMRGILGVGVSDVELRIYDGPATDPLRLLYDSTRGNLPAGEAPSGEPMRALESIAMAGHRWTLELRASPGFLTTGESLQSLVIGFSGLTVDVLLFLIIHAFRRQRGRALALAESMTRDLRSSQERFRAVSDTAHDAILTAGPDGGIVYLNASARRLLGYARAELLGRPLTMLIDPERDPESALVLQSLLRGPRASDGAGVVEVQARRRDGSGLAVEISVARWQTAEGPFVALTLRDITQRKEMEAERADYTAELERSNRELDNFAYVASHDLKAPLRAVENLASWITKDAGDELPEKSRVHLERLRGRVRRMESLLDDLLQYSRAGRVLGDQSLVEVEGLVEEVVALVAPPPGFEVRCVSEAGPFPGYRTPLRQVLQNLVGNALKHHDRNTGEVVVTCSRRGEVLEFVVCDDGPGIAPEFHERVFGMFQTLRSRDEVEGSGMGLAIVRKIIESQGGHVGIERSAGRGTRIRFTWPSRITGEVQRRGIVREA